MVGFREPILGSLLALRSSSSSSAATTTDCCRLRVPLPALRESARVAEAPLIRSSAPRSGTSSPQARGSGLAPIQKLFSR
eukprot:scaffold82447_cov63-Phaeocystis_antarctica.AAC.1